MMNTRRKFGIVVVAMAFFITSGFSLPGSVDHSGWDLKSLAGSGLVDRVSKDNAPPAVSLSISAPTGKNGWYNAPVSVRVHANDGGSGVKARKISIGGATWYNDALMIQRDGIFQVIGIAIDRAGNKGGTSVLIKVDMTPPEVVLDLPAPDGKNGSFVSAVPIKLTGSDALSGVVYSELTVQGTASTSPLFPLNASDAQEAYAPEALLENGFLFKGVNTSVESVIVSIEESGTYSIDGYVEDEAGNKTPVSTQLSMDIDPPFISIESPREFRDDIQLFGNVYDNQSGVDRVLVDYGSGWEAADVNDEGRWKLLWPAGDLKEGKYPIKAKVIDQAGHESLTEYRATVLNSAWPFFTFSLMLVAIALFYAADPKLAEWEKITVQMRKHKRMFKNGLMFDFDEDI